METQLARGSLSWCQWWTPRQLRTLCLLLDRVGWSGLMLPAWLQMALRSPPRKNKEGTLAKSREKVWDGLCRCQCLHTRRSVAGLGSRPGGGCPDRWLHSSQKSPSSFRLDCFLSASNSGGPLPHSTEVRWLIRVQWIPSGIHTVQGEKRESRDGIEFLGTALALLVDVKEQ